MSERRVDREEEGNFARTLPKVERDETSRDDWAFEYVGCILGRSLAKLTRRRRNFANLEIVVVETRREI